MLPVTSCQSGACLCCWRIGAQYVSAHLEACNLVQHDCLELLVRHVAVAQHLVHLTAQLVHLTLPAAHRCTHDNSFSWCQHRHMLSAMSETCGCEHTLLSNPDRLLGHHPSTGCCRCFSILLCDTWSAAASARLLTFLPSLFPGAPAAAAGPAQPGAQSWSPSQHAPRALHMTQQH